MNKFSDMSIVVEMRRIACKFLIVQVTYDAYTDDIVISNKPSVRLKYNDYYSKMIML